VQVTRTHLHWGGRSRLDRKSGDGGDGSENASEKGGEAHIGNKSELECLARGLEARGWKARVMKLDRWRTRCMLSE
jgi:hypothetical protein